MSMSIIPILINRQSLILTHLLTHPLLSHTHPQGFSSIISTKSIARSTWMTNETPREEKIRVEIRKGNKRYLETTMAHYWWKVSRLK